MAIFYNNDFCLFFLFSQMYTPLHASCASGQENVVKLLLELGVEVDAVNMYGNTPLHVACLNGQDLVVRELLLYNANINSVNHKGMVSVVSFTQPHMIIKYPMQVCHLLIFS